MKRIKIPASQEDAITSLTGLGQLITAKEWERAAIVYAFTHEGKAGRPGPKESVKNFTDSWTISDFSRLRIKGLTSRPSVIAYRSAWKEAMAKGLALEPEMGKTVELPDLPFPPMQSDVLGLSETDRTAYEKAAKDAGTTLSTVARIAASPQGVAAAIAASPKVAAAASRALGPTPKPVATTPRERVEAVRDLIGDDIEVAAEVLRDSKAGKAINRAQVRGIQRREDEQRTRPRSGLDEAHDRVQASRCISDARRSVGSALDCLKDTVLDDDGREILLDGVMALENATALLRSAVESGDRSFEEHLADLLGGDPR